MSNELNLELIGIEELINEIERLGKAGSRIENKALREAGDVVKEAIQKEAPIRSGKFVEFGTVKMKANPFMGRGYETSKENAMEKIEKNLKEGL